MIKIPRPLLEEIVTYARRDAPREVCGWLAGRDGRVEDTFPVPNVAGNPRAEFEMDPEVQFSAIREITEQRGLELSGTYHSHPRTPPVPSARDKKLALYPDSAHLIVSLEGGRVEARCYRIIREGAFPLTLRVLPL